MAQGHVEQLVLNQDVYKILRALIHYGIPQSLNKLDEIGDNALTNDVFNAFVTQAGEKPEPPKKGNLHYSFFLPIVWKKIEEVFKKFEKVRVASKDFVIALQSDEKTRMAMRNKHIAADDLLKLPTSIVSSTKDIVKLFREDVMQFYFDKYPILGSQEGRQRVELLKANPFKFNSSKEETMAHSSDFIAMFYAKDILVEQTLLSQEFGIISKKMIFTEKRLYNSVLDAMATSRLEYDTRQLCRAYKRAKDLMQVTRVHRTSFIWEFTDIIFSVYDSLALKTSNEPIIQFDKSVAKIGQSLKENRCTLLDLLNAILSIPISHSITFRKGVSQVLKVSKRARKEVPEISEAILKFTFSSIDNAGIIMNAAFEIFEDNAKLILGLKTIPKFFESVKICGKNKMENDELCQTFRAIILHLLQAKIKEALGERASDPEDSLLYVYQKYTSDPLFFSEYFSIKFPLLKYIYQVIIRAHTHFLSLWMTDVANKKRKLDPENLKNWAAYSLDNESKEAESKSFMSSPKRG